MMKIDETIDFSFLLIFFYISFRGMRAIGITDLDGIKGKKIRIKE